MLFVKNEDTCPRVDTDFSSEIQEIQNQITQLNGNLISQLFLL